MIVRPPLPVSLLKAGNSLGQQGNPSANPANSFEKVLGKALNGVNDLQLQSAEYTTKLASGQLEYLHQATAMSEKANLALQLTIQVRNKVIEAYQEVMRTQF